MDIKEKEVTLFSDNDPAEYEEIRGKVREYVNELGKTYNYTPRLVVEAMLDVAQDLSECITAIEEEDKDKEA